MCGFSTFGCCGCNCDTISLDLRSDGEGGLVHWLPTSELTANQVASLPWVATDITLVSKKDVFCKPPTTPWCLDLGGSFADHPAMLGDTVVRLMARIESTDVDGIATIGDHCFCEISRSDELTGMRIHNTVADDALWFRVGVCIDGVDTIIQSGVGAFLLDIGVDPLRATFGTGLASSTGRIKFAATANVNWPLSYIAGLAEFGEGDYILAADHTTLVGDTANIAAKKGRLYRLDDEDHPGDVASWSEATHAELSNPFLYAGDGMTPGSGAGASIYQSDAVASFSTLTGRKVGYQISGMEPGTYLHAPRIRTNNAIGPKSIACPNTRPAWNYAPVPRTTPLPVYTGSIKGAVTGLIYPQWATRIGGVYTVVDPDMSYLGSGPAESITPPMATQGIIRQTSFCQHGPIDDPAPTPTPYYLYARITAEIKITWSQTDERRFTYRVDADVSYRVDNSGTSWTLAQLLAGEHDMAFAYSEDTTHGGHAETGPITVESHLAPDMTTTLDPTPSGPPGTNRDRLDVFELTLNVPVPQT